MTNLIDIIREVQRETRDDSPREADRPVSRPQYPGDPFRAGERLESILRPAGFCPEDCREESCERAEFDQLEGWA